MATENKSSLDNVLKAINSVTGQEQSMFYSPRVYSDQRNVVESLLLSALVKAYPTNQSVIDQIAPFVKVQTLSNTDGYIQLPDEYRDLLGTPMIFANPESNGECNEVVEPLTQATFKAGKLKAGCNLNPVTIVPQSIFAKRTQSTYDKPTWEDPIGVFVDSNKIQVCPYNISKVSVMFAKKEKVVRYGYIIQPDDTFLFDKDTTIETEFTSNCFPEIFNAMMALYAAYAKDQVMQNWAQVLSKAGIL